MNVYQYILHSLYDNDVIGEDAIMQWAGGLQGEGDEEDKAVLKQCDKFLTWLKEAEEDDDDEEEDEDE